VIGIEIARARIATVEGTPEDAPAPVDARRAARLTRFYPVSQMVPR